MSGGRRGRRALFSPGTSGGAGGAGKRALFSQRPRDVLCGRCGTAVGPDDGAPRRRSPRARARRPRCPSCGDPLPRAAPA